MNIKNRIGKIGENLAKNYLIKNRHRIIAQNFLIKKDEIDIITIAEDGTLVFCEVKALSQNAEIRDGFMPEDNLTPAKRRKLIRSAQIFAGKYPYLIKEDRGWRIDLVAIALSEEEKVLDIRHYENI